MKWEMAQVAQSRRSGHTIEVRRAPHRWVAFAAFAVSAAACSSAAAPTPQIVYVTAQPSVTAPPTATPTQQPSVQPTTGATFAEFTAEFDVFYSGFAADMNTIADMMSVSNVPGAQVRATKMAIDSNTLVTWLNANPPRACYLSLYQAALTAAQDWGAGATLWETWGSGDWRPAYDQGSALFKAAGPLLEGVRAQMATVSCP